MGVKIDIQKKVGSFHLDIRFQSEASRIGILGASGCGKSMTLKSIAGIELPDQGQIELDGKVVYSSKDRIHIRPQERSVGYLFQNYALFPNMTVEQNILCGLYREKDKQEKRRKMQEAVENMGLVGQSGLYPHQLSGGQQQRTALARMLVSQPELLLLDEPFSALDAYLREQMQTQVRRILEQYGKDVLLVSHSRDEVYYLCGRLAVMNQGKILTMGDTRDIFADPGSRTAAILTGCKNIAFARKSGEYEVEVPEWGIRLKTGKQVQDSVCAVGIRAHYFNPKTRDNQFPVIYSAGRDEPFESRILFRYIGQREGTPDVWWRITKERKPQQMPEKLGIAPDNVLLLYPE